MPRLNIIVESATCRVEGQVAKLKLPAANSKHGNIITVVKFVFHTSDENKDGAM